ncbi:XAC2610-related protein [Psychrobacter aquaticus]|uniref:Uncharacterized protein n=1 Tax=Psychrobacter aquaticus CMS 56 TaxID=1354303 RepID=U4T5U4_9GAMM|nr:hypothetical protein [Psychrobacter aquaticus]ERL56752.1 hypothetical protein M917_0382 [Psychrobacter aquaticus CMS 56]
MNTSFIPKKLFKLSPLPVALLFLPFLICPAFAQTYQIQDFSDDYDAVIKTVNDEDSEANSVINIIDIKTKKVLISQPADIDIDYELDNSKERQLGKNISANIVSIPYGEHSILIYKDFNFDWQKDLALKDGSNGCYGGPSYQVYLKKGAKFAHSEAFTELAQGYCGFFGVDEDSQTLSTMTKSGAAWHQFSEYKVIDNKPVAVHIIEEEYNARGLVSITEKTKVNGKMLIDNYEMLPPRNGSNEGEVSLSVYRFDLENGKKMVLDSTDGETLIYMFADKDGKIELSYDGQFDYDASKKTLSFTKKSVRYQINNNGITVKLPNKTVSLKSNVKSAQGSLNNLAKFKNVN